MLSTAIILLAAGGSSRLGRPKQLLPCGSQTLLRHAAETAVNASLGPVVAVLGAVEKECREELLGLPVAVVSHPAWQEGMGSSIAAGAAVLEPVAHRAVIIMLCDQPGISPQVLRSLDERQRTTGKSIVGCCYDGVVGPPALFTSLHFPQLRRLKGRQGAGSLIQGEDALHVGVIDCPEAAHDVDTEADAAVLLKLVP